jgi:vacuolar iron transporter family protein
MHPKDHNRHKLGTAGWLRAAVLGANDGIVSTSSWLLGLAAARVGALRVAFWSALAMAVTTAVGAAVGQL